MIRKIAYASCYVYSPAGAGVVCEHSRLLCALLKAADAQFLVKYALRVHQQAQESPQLAGFFRSDDLLVPVPGSVPDTRGSTWAAADLADALVHAGVGTMVWRGLHRICPVRKSATAAPGARPTVALHYASFLMERPRITAQSRVQAQTSRPCQQRLLRFQLRLRKSPRQPSPKRRRSRRQPNLRTV